MSTPVEVEILDVGWVFKKFGDKGYDKKHGYKNLVKVLMEVQTSKQKEYITPFFDSKFVQTMHNQYYTGFF